MGALVTDLMGRQAVRRVGRLPPEPAHRGARDRRSPAHGIRAGTRSGRGVRARSARTASATSWRWPRGRRRSATRCWTPRSGWRPGCWTTTRTATTRSPARSSTTRPVGNLTRDHILDNITLYWLTGTADSPPGRTGRTHAPGRIPCQRPGPAAGERAGRRSPHSRARSGPSPRSWVEAVYPDLAYFNEADRGGHFAAWEEPQLFTDELRAAFRPLR